MEHLRQKRFGVTREYVLTDSGIRTKYKDLKKTYENEVDWDMINGKRERLVEGDIILYLIFRIGLIISVLSLVGIQLFEWLTIKITLYIGATSAVSLLLYILSRKDYIKIRIDNDKALCFFKNIPSEEQVEMFLQKLFDKRDDYLRKNYLDLDPRLPYEKMAKNLQILFEYRVIDQGEYDQKKMELKNLFKEVANDSNPIGFKLPHDDINTVE